MLSDEVVVSIKCLVYNHEPFLRQCLDGFVMQKTNFKFEAIVHDDCSTDNSVNIIKEYAKKYPNIIKPIYENENQYSKGFKIALEKINKAFRGKYIALCEGDDYWTDPYKLQKQVDFLESHPDYVVCSHCYQIYKHNDQKMGEIFPKIESSITFDIDSHISGFWATQPLTCVYLRTAIDQNYSKYENAKDFSFFYNMLTKGKGFLMKDVMGVYRIHGGGVWSGVSSDDKLFADLACFKGIYDVEQTDQSAELIHSFFKRNPSYFSLCFNLKYFSKLLPYWRIIGKRFGYKELFVILLHELHLRDLFRFKH